jgi:hypothetical protein
VRNWCCAAVVNLRISHTRGGTTRGSPCQHERTDRLVLLSMCLREREREETSMCLSERERKPASVKRACVLNRGDAAEWPREPGGQRDAPPQCVDASLSRQPTLDVDACERAVVVVVQQELLRGAGQSRRVRGARRGAGTFAAMRKVLTGFAPTTPASSASAPIAPHLHSHSSSAAHPVERRKPQQDDVAQDPRGAGGKR